MPGGELAWTRVISSQTAFLLARQLACGKGVERLPTEVRARSDVH